MTFNVVAAARLGPYEGVVGLLQAQGCAVAQLPADASRWTDALIDRHATSADAYVGMFVGIGLPAEVLAQSQRARIVTSPIIGTEHIDVTAATDLGIVVAHGATAENFVGMAEATVMLIAALRKHLPEKIAALSAGVWRPVGPGQMVQKSTIGLIGFGNIGRAVSRLLSGWECRLIVADPYVDEAAVAAHNAELMPLDDLLRQADVTVVLVTLTAETHHIIDKAAIGRMKPGAYLINVGRGGCVDELALSEALDSGRLAGAAIDTWEAEPVPAGYRLVNHPKVIATAHVIGHSQEAYASMEAAAVENTLRGLRGQEPLYVRNPAVLPKWRERLAKLDGR